MRTRRLLPVVAMVAAVAMLTGCALRSADEPTAGAQTGDESTATTEGRDDGEPRTVPARVQSRPGGPMEEVEMKVHPVPVQPRTVPADEVDLPDDELVLGMVADGRAVAYPVRYLALSEVVNDRVGEAAITPTW